jgi:hypothetical protein
MNIIVGDRTDVVQLAVVLAIMGSVVAGMLARLVEADGLVVIDAGYQSSSIG